FGSRRRLDEDDPSPRLRRPPLLLARVFRVQDGAAVRIFEVHAWRRRQGAALPRVVEYREGGTSASPAGTISRARPRAGGVSPARISSTERTRDEAAGTCGEAAGTRGGVRRLYADRCRRRPFRIRAN